MKKRALALWVTIPLVVFCSGGVLVAYYHSSGMDQFDLDDPHACMNLASRFLDSDRNLFIAEYLVRRGLRHTA